MNEGIDKVGMGVDLIGGPEVLATLREIRQEMTAISQIARTNTGSTNRGQTVQSQVNDTEKILNTHRQRELREEAQHQRNMSAITDKDIDREIARRNRVTEIRRRADAREVELERQKQQEITNIQSRAELQRQTMIERSRARRASVDPNAVIDKTFDRRVDKFQGRRVAQENRTSREQDARDNLASEIRVSRQAQRERRRLAEEEIAQEKANNLRLIKEREDAARRLRAAEIDRRSQDPAVLRRNINPSQIANLPSALRGDIELDIAAQRLAKRRQQDEQDKRDYEKRKAEDNARKAEQRRLFDEKMEIMGRQFVVEDQMNRRVAKSKQDVGREVARANQPILGPTRRDFVDPLEQQKLADRIIDSNAKQIQAAQRFSTSGPHALLANDARLLEGRFESLSLRAARLRTELSTANSNRPFVQVAADLRKVDAEVEEVIRDFRQLRLHQDVLAGGNGGRVIGPRRPGGPGGPVPPNFNAASGALNEKGFFTSLDATARITRNILLYEVVSRASYGLVQYTSDALNAAKATVEYENALRFATETAGGNVQKNLELGDSMLNIGLSRQQGRQAVTEAVRFAEERPQDTEALVKVVADIAAQRGEGIDRTDELIEQLRRRESKFYKRIFGKTVESIYEDEALQRLSQNTTNVVDNSGLYIGVEATEIKSRKEAIASYVASMDDAAKEQAVLNYILAQGNRFQGEAAERATTLAGRMDMVSAAWLNGKEGLGLFITDLRIVNDLMTGLAGNVGILDNLRGPTLGRSGPGGTITQYDVDKFGIDRTTGPRARAINAIDNFGPTAVLGGLGLGAAALFGRRTATNAVRNQAYTQALQQASVKFNGDLAAATTEALAQAQGQKASIARSIYTGLQRVTVGFTTHINDLTASAIGGPTGARMRRGSDAIRFGSANFNPAGAGVALGVGGPFRGTIPAGMSLEEYKSLKQITPPSAAQTGGAVGGGLVGGALGFTIGSMVADSITSNTIVATGISILGGAAGTAGGTFLGNAAGAAIGAKAGGIGAAVAGGFGIAGGIASLLALPAIAATIVATDPTAEVNALRREEIKSGAYAKLAKEERKAFEEDRIRFRFVGPDKITQEQFRERTASGSGFTMDAPLGLITGKEVVSRGDSLLNYVKEIIPPVSEAIESLRKLKKEREEILNNTGIGDSVRQFQLNQKDAELDNAFLDAAIGAESRAETRTRFEESRRKRVEKESKERQELISEQTNALSKLRDAEQGSFRLIGDIGQLRTGPDNPYVKILSDQITAAERMQQQWGFLGQSAVDYFTKLEQGAISMQLIKQEFATLAQTQELLNRADRERSERNGPGVNRRQEQGLAVISTSIDRAIKLSELNKRESDIRGQGRFDVPGSMLKEQINGIIRAGRLGFGADGRQSSVATADAILGLTSNMSAGSIENDPYLRDVVMKSIDVQRKELGRRVQDEILKAESIDEESARLSRDLAMGEELRRRQISQGLDPNIVGREHDRFIIGRTEGIAPKDLSFQEFEGRNAALRREAERSVQEAMEARRAVQLGLQYQELMKNDIAIIRAAITGGDLKMLIQVQNDTQARIDQENLKLAHSGQFNIPLDQGETKTNPYANSFGRYSRGGRKK